jgi:hypothetical protein
MFVGHYGVSGALKRQAPDVPLWLLFIAVQFLDVLWGIFVLFGIEKVHVVPGFMKLSPLDLYYMPYTHSLTAALSWSVLAALAFRAWRGREHGRSAAWVGLAVFSHWLLDLPMHRPDLPLVGDRFKVGLGLWNHPVPAITLEFAVLVSGMLIYARSTQARSAAGTWGLWTFVVALIALQLGTMFGPLPASNVAIGATLFLTYMLLAALAGWIDTKRAPLLPYTTPVPLRDVRAGGIKPGASGGI